ncbi:hypothetical protein [uncultured Dialister sp.]|uniref:hypothetical protein n=1 Tax=uncultured Dialister sp. TaxID=278064 RepID=UPI002628DC33|nr:hypothetical protein [uncultured Dialister sp.]
MKRKGLMLLDALMALLLLSVLSVMMAPLAGSWLTALEMGTVRTKLSETGLSAMDFMVEKIRNNRRIMTKAVNGDSYDYVAITDKGTDGTYRFFVDREKLKIQLYNDTIQPITGEHTGPEGYAFRPGEGNLFRQIESGPVRISFTMHQQIKGTDMDFETSVIPYADFYEKGKAYE